MIRILASLQALMMGEFWNSFSYGAKGVTASQATLVKTGATIYDAQMSIIPIAAGASKR